MAYKVARRQEAARIRERLARLAAEAAELTARLGELEAKEPPVRYSDRLAGPVTNRSAPSEKVALFRDLSALAKTCSQALGKHPNREVGLCARVRQRMETAPVR